MASADHLSGFLGKPPGQANKLRIEERHQHKSHWSGRGKSPEAGLPAEHKQVRREGTSGEGALGLTQCLGVNDRALRL
jgi:hypothetical protein